MCGAGAPAPGLYHGGCGLFVFHQANARITDLVARKLGIPPEKYYKNIDRYGNTSAGSIPLVLSELHEMGRVDRAAGFWPWALEAA